MFHLMVNNHLSPREADLFIFLSLLEIIGNPLTYSNAGVEYLPSFHGVLTQISLLNLEDL